MNTKETSTRELAINWWINLTYSQLRDLNLDNLRFNGIGWEYTEEEIEEIWAKENPIADEMINTDFEGIEEEHNSFTFDENRFITYFDNLSNQDKLLIYDIVSAWFIHKD